MTCASAHRLVHRRGNRPLQPLARHELNMVPKSPLAPRHWALLRRGRASATCLRRHAPAPHSKRARPRPHTACSGLAHRPACILLKTLRSSRLDTPIAALPHVVAHSRAPAHFLGPDTPDWLRVPFPLLNHVTPTSTAGAQPPTSNLPRRCHLPLRPLALPRYASPEQSVTEKGDRPDHAQRWSQVRRRCAQAAAFRPASSRPPSCLP